MAGTGPENGVPRLQHTTASEAVVEVLRAAILNGQFTPGTQLREAHLASDMGISRAPVREAISQLVDEGLVVKVSYKGASVADVSENEVSDIADVRKMVEATVMRNAVASKQVDIRPFLEEALNDMRKAAQYDVISMSVTAHMEFHRIFYAHCGNAILANMWRSWQGQLQLFFSKDHTVFADLASVTREHEHLLNLAYASDVDTLQREVERHVHGSIDPSHWKTNPPSAGLSDLDAGPSSADRELG